MRYNPINDRFMLTFGSYSYTTRTVFNKADTPFQFFKVSLQYQVKAGTLVLKVNYLDGTILFEETGTAKSTISYLPQGQYQIIVGYTLSNSLQGQFEIAGVEFFDKYLSSKELVLYQYNGIQECQNACYKITQGVCTVPVVDEDIFIGLDSYGAYNNAPLFYIVLHQLINITHSVIIMFHSHFI